MLVNTLTLLSLLGTRQDATDLPPTAKVIKPANSTMEQFKADFEDLCPRYYAPQDHGQTDQPIFVSQSFEADSLSDDAAEKKRDIDPDDIATVSCIYLYYSTTPYQNIGVDVAIALGGDGLVTIDD
ncbi:hypothetical protein L202_00793 [Cryptococcus amylolentus CBS 6039]|uniref:Uncharacterized protein n=2 Tax=Cryptococcus amylolentus TaxID=104669 RepID=A0A1E3I8Y5_9TREE|nr:hypothetical protein L202_00793 [Cryptococcus amylolentus CBS 6039]ODN84948.1 hypothetical protein L202_00793 [Cryptococcus amylolentus CBS 6039]ODO11353.1 hypothetical protein I350_00132 [Cryptococcus amylolentus CBS 6273]